MDSNIEEDNESIPELISDEDHNSNDDYDLFFAFTLRDLRNYRGFRIHILSSRVYLITSIVLSEYHRIIIFDELPIGHTHEQIDSLVGNWKLDLRRN